MNRTARLAELVAAPSPPDDVRHVARRAVATAVPAATGAADDELVRRIRAVIGELAAPGLATLLGRGEATGPALAALANGAAASLDGHDDRCPETGARTGPVVVPAALAVAELVHADGDRLVDAVAAGLEVGLRAARALGRGHVDRGWDVSSTAGQLGAVAAAAAALGLDDEGAARALGLGATQVAGLGCALGTMVEPLHLGKAAANGVEAALLAAEGLEAPADGIGGRRGMLAVAVPDADAEALVDGLGERWLARAARDAGGAPGRASSDAEVLAQGVDAAARTLGRRRAAALTASCLGRGASRSARGLAALAVPAR